MRALSLAAGINEGGHYFIGPSEVRATSGATYWSERSACDQRSNLGRPLFLVINLFFSSFLFIPLFKTPEGVVVGFQIFAWAPKYHKY